ASEAPPGACAAPRSRSALLTNAGGFAIRRRRRVFQSGRKGDRHGQGSDAQQQGKEETEGRQEPQEGRRGTGQSVRGRQDAGGPEPQQQEELTPGFCGSSRQRFTGPGRPVAADPNAAAEAGATGAALSGLAPGIHGPDGI